MAHRPNCNDFQDMDPGFAANTGDAFIKKYKDRFAQFPIDTYKKCLGCCLAYLTRDRNYTRLDTQPGLFYVHFPVVRNPSDRFRIPSVTSFAQGTRGKRGQIATGKDPNLGKPFRRTFQDFRTYQLYVPHDDSARGLSIGFPCNARMESVAIDVVDQVIHCDIADIKLSFFDAVLVERYKETSGETKISASFGGYCMTPTGPNPVNPLVEEMQNVAIN